MKKHMTFLTLLLMVLVIGGCKSKDEPMGSVWDNETSSASSSNAEREETVSETALEKDEPIEMQSDYSSYIGNWSSKNIIEFISGKIPAASLYITEVDGNYITFSVVCIKEVGRPVESNVITSEIVNGTTSFVFSDSRGISGSGQLIFRDDFIIAITNAAGDNTEGITINEKMYRSDENYDDAVDYIEPEIQNEEEYITSFYMPVEGNYNRGVGENGTTTSINITYVDQSSFRFVIYKDNNMVFKEHIARFEEQDSTIAVFRGNEYTLFFDCEEYGIIILTGFEELIAAPENEFWNSIALGSS